MMKRMKVHGMRRSGNNWLLRLLLDNYYVDWIGNGDSHTHDPIATGMEVDYLFIIVKHPLAWLPSICRYKKQRFPQYAEILDWNFTYRRWLDEGERHNAHIIRYEQLLAGPEKLLDSFGMPKIGNWIQHERKMNRRGGVSKYPFNKDYYLKKGYMVWYSGNVARTVMDTVDKDVLERLGYGNSC